MCIRYEDNKLKLIFFLAFTTGLSKGMLLECIDAGFGEDGECFTIRQYYTLLEQKAIILIFISIIDINANLSKNEIDRKINFS